MDSTTSCELLSFLDVYLGYHQISLAIWATIFWSGISASVEVPVLASWDTCRKASKRRPKIIFTIIKSSGLRDTWYGGSSIWIIIWSNEGNAHFHLGTGGGCFRLRPPTGGAVEATQSMTEGSNCPSASDLIGLGATVLAEEAPHPQHHRQLISLSHRPHRWTHPRQ
jgi:hypothetical protein